ncbi:MULTISPECIES: MtrAB system histidine kinase MtrB [unclassified Frigoribacterium]|uniref:MtrAB system histidine kinase MtrB n=1 Tax=unclassified Frigoribacterium TaxID=2627005 RepID=UPI00177CDD97|nr:MULTISPECIES: MtrAB system histidine kinase MtrB [unclassified Frigoribacterium]MBD8702444.1 HAMP domain-containing histidine kinase [Frigoribacterium sp. CFBP 13712]MDY0891270.1 MtrAB system histidine kinase MtrB [Frigoribacterium sp. CFBP9030]
MTSPRLALPGATVRRLAVVGRRLSHVWRSSLELRTVALTVVLAGVGASIIAASISVSIGANLFDQRRDQVQSESLRATLLAQSIFDSATATEDADQVELDSLQNEAQSAILGSTSSPGGTRIAILRTPGQTTARTIQNIASPDFPADVITSDLRRQVAADTGSLALQSVSLASTSGGAAPGIAVGSTLQVPTAGQYELYLVYDLGDAEATLALMQRTLAIGSIALVALIALITYAVVRLVVAPVRVAAETSQKIAAGHLEERIPEKGEDVVATLGRSFNGMADAMQRQISQLAELSRVQQRFVSDVSHELRTPLTTIRLAGDVLYDQREGFSPSAARTTELLHTQVDRFELLLADLLEISRFDAGAVELELERITLVRLVEDGVAEYEPLAAETGSEIEIVARGGYFETEVDARRVRRIFRNLLGNAIEHGEGRPITVEVDSDPDSVAIAVHDHGVGMTEADAERVFDRFWRADPSRRRTIGGTGLGLAISLEDAVLHGGRIDVWSRPGEGSRFVMTLPRVVGRPVASWPLPIRPEGLS